VGQQRTVSLPLCVLDSNNVSYPSLRESDLKVSSGNRIVEPEKLVERSNNALEIAILVDVSVSQNQVIPAEKLAAETFIDTVLKKGDSGAIFKFSGDLHPVQGFTEDLQKAKDKLRAIKFEPPRGYVGGGIMVGTPPPVNSSEGSTSLWESVIEALKTFDIGPPQRTERTILLLSDGVNIGGDVKMKRAIQYSVNNQVPIFAIGIGDSFYNGVDKSALRKLTEDTGGIAAVPKNDGELRVSIGKMNQCLRNSYDAVFQMAAGNSVHELKEIKLEIVDPALRKKGLQIFAPRLF
jgi:VWFA-related protein